MSDAVLRKRLPIPGLGTSYLFADRKSTRLNSSHLVISYAVFCLKKKTNLTIVNFPLLVLGTFGIGAFLVAAAALKLRSEHARVAAASKKSSSLRSCGLSFVNTDA